jgi:hypothetical protein
MSKKPKSGQIFHQLVEAIEKAINHKPNAKIESPKRLRDKDTGRLREHDVVITFQESHHTILIALECRDRSRPIGVPDVEGFSKKCEKTGINKGVMVSAKGFTKSALKKAASLDIGCLELNDAKKFDWCAAPDLIQYQRVIEHADLKIILPSMLQVPFKLFENNGTEVGTKEGIQIGVNCLNQIPPNEQIPESGEMLFIDKNPNFYIATEDGARHIPQSIEVKVKYHTKIRLLPFKFLKYEDRKTGEELYSIASTDFEHGEFKGKMMLVNKPAEGIRVVFVPEAKK